jgi:tRNA(Arg) A34 adenosine deaminase TadA
VRRRIEISLPVWLDQILDASPVLGPTPEDRMAFAVSLAGHNVAEGTGGPFGAAVVEVESGRVVSAGVNVVVPTGDCTAHAEMVAIELAERARGGFDLADPQQPRLELVTSVEPCAMCLGAVVWSGISRLVCGARSGEAARIGFDEGPRPQDWVVQLECRGVQVVRDVMDDAARRVLSTYAAQGGTIYNPGQ